MAPQKWLLSMLAAMAMLVALASSASARNLSTTSQTWVTSYRELRFNGAFGNITCEVTLEGSLHSRTIAKVLGSLVGYITRVIEGPCPEGRATLLKETLPWHIRYLTFIGTLPNVIFMRTNIVNFNIRIQEPFAGCLGRSTAESPAALTFNRETPTGVLTSTEVGGTIPTSCGINGSFSSNRGRVTVLNSTTRITLTLI